VDILGAYVVKRVEEVAAKKVQVYNVKIAVFWNRAVVWILFETWCLSPKPRQPTPWVPPK
jgi:hypothetical protein